MIDWKFEIDFGTGFQAVPPPINWKGIIISILFIDDQPNATLSGLNLQWVGDNAVRLNQYFQAGLTGGTGIGEGVGLRITPCNGEVLFDGYIDLGDESTTFECDSVTAPCVEKGRVDWLNKYAAGESFATLATLPIGAIGRIVPATDYKKIPYCIDHIPNWGQLATLSVSSVIILRELYSLIDEITERLADLAGDVTTSVTTVGATTPNVAAEIIKTVTYIIYLGAIVVSLVAMANSILKNLWQSKKYKLGMREEDCWKRICQRFGLGFSSSIYAQASSYKDTTHVPAKNSIPSSNNPLNVFQRPFDESIGFPNNPDVYGHPDENCADFIVRMNQKYNAGISIINNVLYFEEVHYLNTASTFVIPNTDAQGNTFNLPQPNKTNWFELPSDLYLDFSTDPTELNTIHRYKGTSCEVQVTPITISNIQRQIKGRGVQVHLPEALAKRKDYLSRVENGLNSLVNGLFMFCNAITSLINGLLSALNTIISAFGGNTTTIPLIPALPTNILNNRLGWMEVSNDSFATPKTFIGQASGTDWKIHPSSETIMSALGLMNSFHGKNLATRGNQQLIYADRQFKFCCGDYQLLRNRNIATSPTGRPAKFRGELKWDLHNDILTNVTWSEFVNFTNNVTEKVIVDGK